MCGNIATYVTLLIVQLLHQYSALRILVLCQAEHVVSNKLRSSKPQISLHKFSLEDLPVVSIEDKLVTSAVAVY